MSANIDDQIEYAERLLKTAKRSVGTTRRVQRQIERDQRCIEAIIETLNQSKVGIDPDYSDPSFCEIADALDEATAALKAINDQAEQLASLPGISSLSQEMKAVERIIELSDGA